MDKNKFALISFWTGLSLVVFIFVVVPISVLLGDIGVLKLPGGVVLFALLFVPMSLWLSLCGILAGLIGTTGKRQMYAYAGILLCIFSLIYSFGIVGQISSISF